MSTDPSDRNAIQIARRLLQQRKINEALAIIQEIKESDPDDREAQELLGMALFMSRQFEEAKEAFDLLVRMDPRNATAWVNLGAVQNVLKDHQGSIRSLRNAIKRDKKSASAYYNMGIAQKAMKMNSMAISAYKEALRLDPLMADAYINLGNLYIDMNNLTQAVRLLKDGLEKCPQSKKMPVVLEKAQRAKDGVRVKDAPLGRLVDEKELQRRQIRTAPRQLEPAQRVNEREALHDFGKTMRRSTKPIVELLKNRLQQQIHVLDLAAAQKDSRGEAPATYDQMTQTLAEMEELRKTAKEASGQIRDLLSKTDPGF